MVVPDESATVRRFRFSRRFVRLGVFLAVLVLGGLSAAGFHYYEVMGEAREARALRLENIQIRSELRLVQEKIAHVSEALDRVERLDSKLRVLTQVNDPDRNLAIGPLSGSREVLDEIGGGLGIDTPGQGAFLAELEGIATDTDIELLQARLDTLAAEAQREEASLRQLNEYFQDQKTLLGAMPSIWPTRGWTTSTFGTRLDPFTGERTMHLGMDIAAPLGTKVKAPANGVVTKAEVQGAYGNVVYIDHGYGVETRYGHLAEVFVEKDQELSRGQEFAAIGNTGRSTGPHLHYEVRVNGIPENPRKFILDWE